MKCKTDLADMKIYFRWPNISVRREQAFLSGGKNKKWEEGNNKMRGKRRRMLKKKQKIPQKQQTNFDILKYRLGIYAWGIKQKNSS